MDITVIRRKKVYKAKKVPKKIPPVTSERTLHEVRKQTNATNKARSKAMENRIAKMLSGRRIPMSGAAAAFKGDVEVLFENYPGKYIVECKLSAQKDTSTKEPFIPIKLEWFPKLAEEASNMNAKFGILIIHYKDFSDDYVFIKRGIVQKLITQYNSPYANVLRTLLEITNVIDMRFHKTGIAKTGHNLLKKDIETQMIQYNGFHGVRVLTVDDEYLVIHLSTWIGSTAHM